MLKRQAPRVVLIGMAASAVVAAAVFGIAGSAPHWPALASRPVEAVVATVRIGDFFFCDPGGPKPCIQPHDTTINVGDTVTWEWGVGGTGTIFRHTTTNCADNFVPCNEPREWDSASLFQSSGTFSHTFGAEDVGKTFSYRCEIHPLTMRGRIIVQAPPSVGGITDFPDIDESLADASISSGSSSLLPTALASGLAAAVATAASGWYAWRRWLR